MKKDRLNLAVKRRWFAETYTIGSFFVDGIKLCDTIEDKYRDLSKYKKVWGETAIPNGIYRVILAFSNKFKRILPRLQAVPHFEGILIHRGNTAKDSAGCIIVGENKAKGKVISSIKYELEIVELCDKAIKDGKEIFITIE